MITGELDSLDRWDAWTLAARLGAQPQKNVTKRTTMVVVAHHHEIPSDYDPLQGSGKERKAGERLLSGQAVTFMGGGEFLARLGIGTLP
ncbi:hypothetical protein AB0K08_08220 [Citricoccus sp. NPDC055426]|uniref:hypothetical protein n=1 Tax=Citricoccus sp. NPDC055426 TaxID=3155536 RepID=UPI00343471C3